jgi:hypothetical protein
VRNYYEKNNIRKCDALDYAKNGTLENKLKELFPELSCGKESVNSAEEVKAS